MREQSTGLSRSPEPPRSQVLAARLWAKVTEPDSPAFSAAWQLCGLHIEMMEPKDGKNLAS